MYGTLNLAPRLRTATLNLHTANSHYALQVNESNVAILSCLSGTFAGERHRAMASLTVPSLMVGDYSLRPAFALVQRDLDLDRASAMMRGLLLRRVEFRLLAPVDGRDVLGTTPVRRVEWTV